MNKVMKGFLMMALIFTVSLTQAQETRKERKEREKQEQREIYAQNLSTYGEWVENREFVVLINNITGRNGSVINLHSTVNFIEVNGEEITIQTSHPATTGLNGLGGTTTKGQISNIKVHENDRGELVSMMINFSTPLLGPANLNIHVNGDGYTTAYLRGNWGRMVTFRGEFSHLDQSNTFEGMRIF